MEVSQSSSMQEDKTNGSKQKLSKREKAQSSMQQEDKLKCEFLIVTMDMGSWFHSSSLSIYGGDHVIDKKYTQLSCFNGKLL